MANPKMKLQSRKKTSHMEMEYKMNKYRILRKFTKLSGKKVSDESFIETWSVKFPKHCCSRGWQLERSTPPSVVACDVNRSDFGRLVRGRRGAGNVGGKHSHWCETLIDFKLSEPEITSLWYLPVVWGDFVTRPNNPTNLNYPF